MVNRNLRNSYYIAATSALVLLTRLPLLLSGYGSESDAWNFAFTAEDIATSSAYHVSRNPGYPLLEFVLSQLFALSQSVKLAPYLLYNIATLVVTALCALVLARILQGLSIDYRLPVLFFLFFPELVINSANTSDYSWALLFLLLAIWSVTEREIYLAAILLGFAAASRFQVATLVPAFVVYLMFSKTPRLKTIGFLATCMVTTWLLYSGPIIERGYGTFLDPGRAHGILRLRDLSDVGLFVLKIGYALSLRSFGLFGSVLLALYLVLALRRRENWRPDAIDILHLSIVGITLVVIMLKCCFNEYLLLAVPSLLILASRYCSMPALVLLFGAVASANVVDLKLWDSTRHQYSLQLGGRFVEELREARGKRRFFETFHEREFPPDSVVVVAGSGLTGRMYNPKCFRKTSVASLEPYNSDRPSERVELFRNTCSTSGARLYSTLNFVRNPAFREHFQALGYELLIDQETVWTLERVLGMSLDDVSHRILEPST